jgi:EmrB/QacA subfamily drug resistance transporter
MALFMVVLDNLVVTVALPSIRHDLGATVQSLEWTVNAYVLAYAVLLLTGAALGDRFGRKRMFLAGLALFTASSAAAALAPSTTALIVARVLQGTGAAIVTPLTLTLLATTFPAERRGAAIGVWSGISGAAVAIGPLVGGAVVQGISWHWIFWINVPIGLVMLPLAWWALSESRGPANRLDVGGLLLASTGLFGLVFGLVRAQSLGWTSAVVLGSLVGGVALLVGFVVWERDRVAPMLPLDFFRRRSFAVTNAVSVAMYFGMFGSIFLLTQFLQFALHSSPLQAGLKMLVWTGATMLVAPLAGIFSERYGARPFMIPGLALQAAGLAWLAAIARVGLPYGPQVAPMFMAGAGMALVFAPSASAVLRAVRPEQAGQASGATNALREVGGVFGVAVLASVFAAHGGYGSPQAFVHGLRPALWVGAAVLGAGALIAAAVPFGRAREVALPGAQGREVAATPIALAASSGQRS